LDQLGLSIDALVFNAIDLDYDFYLIGSVFPKSEAFCVVWIGLDLSRLNKHHVSSSPSLG
jgi:hypothetical protein